MSDLEMRLWVVFGVIFIGFIKGYQFWKEGKF